MLVLLLLVFVPLVGEELGLGGAQRCALRMGDISSGVGVPFDLF